MKNLLAPVSICRLERWVLGAAISIACLAPIATKAQSDCQTNADGIRMCCVQNCGGASAGSTNNGTGDSRREARRQEKAERAQRNAEIDERNARSAEIWARASAAWERGDYVEALRLFREVQAVHDGPNVRAAIANAERVISRNAQIAEEEARATNFRVSGDIAMNSHDYAEALRLYRETQAVRDGPIIRAAIAAAEDMIVRVAARASASSLVEQGSIAWKGGDLRAALALYKRAVAVDPTVLSEDGKTWVQELEKSLGAADSVQQSVNSFVRGLGATPSSGGLDFVPGNAADSASGGGGLDFTADIATGGKKRTGAFGSNESNAVPGPILGKGIVGTNTKPGDQLGSVGKTDKALGSLKPDAALQTARDGFDTGARERGSLSDVKVVIPASTMQMPVVPSEIANDAVITAALGRYNKWAPELAKANQEVERAQAKSDAAIDPGAKGVALAVLNAAQSKKDGLVVAVKSVVKEVSERMINLGILPIPSGTAKGPKTPNGTKIPSGKK